MKNHEKIVKNAWIFIKKAWIFTRNPPLFTAKSTSTERPPPAPRAAKNHCSFFFPNLIIRQLYGIYTAIIRQRIFDPIWARSLSCFASKGVSKMRVLARFLQCFTMKNPELFMKNPWFFIRNPGNFELSQGRTRIFELSRCLGVFGV